MGFACGRGGGQLQADPSGKQDDLIKIAILAVLDRSPTNSSCENARVLKWVLERIAGSADAIETPIGMVPRTEDLDVSGLELGSEALESLLAVDQDEWRNELSLIEEHYETIGDRLPSEMRVQLERLADRLAS